jgi:pyruvate formate lyase activating enzyme
LIEYPGKISSVVFVPGCNLRCPFCFNKELVMNDKNLPVTKDDEIFQYLKGKKGWIDAVCVSGGEPTLQKDLPEFLGKVKELGLLTGLETNGTKPDVLKRLLDEKLLDRVMMDIKGSRDRYSECCGVKVDVKKIEESIDLVKKSGVDHEFRMTIVPKLHKKEDLISIGEWLKGSKVLVLQQFKPEKTLDKEYQKVKPYEVNELRSLADSMKPYFEDVVVRNI